MPNTNSIEIKILRRSPRFLHNNPISPPTLPDLRRSPPEIRQVHSLRPSNNTSLKTPKSVKSIKPCVDSSKNKDSITGSGDFENLNPNLRRSSRLNNGVGGNPSIGNSGSYSGWKREKCGGSEKETALLRGNVGERDAKCGGIHVVDGEMEKKSMGRRKRKVEDNSVFGNGIGQGWTKEQEAALQRAYYAANPNPQFWNKVSKLVPGKSAQDCFDKVHSDHLTPPQPRPRSRTHRAKSSQIELSSLSAAKLLNLDGAKSRNRSCKRRKIRNAQKAVRYLLEKNFQGAHSCEADVFAQLEPNHSPLPNKQQLLSTPDLQDGRGLESPSENHKNPPISRFRNSVERVVVSPPVLKQVKNRALHEKYIDQLHCREAKRKSLSKCRNNCISNEKATRTNDLGDAKNVLITDAKDAIHRLQYLHENSVSKVLDSDDDNGLFDNVGSENEDEL